MNSEPSVILFVRDECHLCRVAGDLLLRSGVPWNPVYVEDDPALDERYGLRVPVVRHLRTGEELDFPFDGEALLRFMSQQGDSPAGS